MDSLMKQLARELTDAVSAAVARDARVEACREKARAAGLDMRVSLEAVVAFASREGSAAAKGSTGRRGSGKSGLEMSANDRRFLKSLRISADETTEKEVE
jgi:Tfp pilus assembly protein FimT